MSAILRTPLLMNASAAVTKQLILIPLPEFHLAKGVNNHSLAQSVLCIYF